MPKRFLLGCFCIIGLLLQAQTDYPQNYFSSPLPIPLYLSGTFGELRGNHFHSGMDIKTQGVEGIPVLAAADGDAYRVKVSPYGFGNALYLSHPNGYNTVYAHLQRFHPKIEAYVRKTQYAQERFDVEVFPSRGTFSFKKGDTIAYSGNSGGSGGPHLHFEVRNARNENIINPLLFGFDVKDNITPRLNYLQLYTFTEEEMTSSTQRRLINKGNGTFVLSGNDLIEFENSIAFGVNVYDQLNGAPNKNGPYKILLCVNGKEVYHFKTETFAFSETRYINSHIDYARKKCCNQVINRLYLEPGNQLSMYTNTHKMNLFNPQNGSIHEVKLTVEDLGGNQSTLSFRVKQTGSTQNDAQPEEILPANTYTFLHTQTNYFKNDEVEFALPSGALYNNVLFEYNTEDNCTECLSKTYKLGDIGIGVQKYYTLKIKIPERLKGKTEKLCVVSVRDGKIADYEGSNWQNGYITARTRQLGDFAIAEDTEAPKLRSINARNGDLVNGKNELNFSMSDNLSGIKTYRATLDGKWVLLTYDAKYNRLTLDLEKEEITAGQKEFLLVATDKLGNTSRLQLSLTF